MARYRTRSGRVFALGEESTLDAHADSLEEKLRAIRDRERAGDRGESRIFPKGMTPLPQAELDAKEASWDRYVERYLREIREAVAV